LKKKVQKSLEIELEFQGCRVNNFSVLLIGEAVGSYKVLLFGGEEFIWPPLHNTQTKWNKENSGGHLKRSDNNEAFFPIRYTSTE